MGVGLKMMLKMMRAALEWKDSRLLGLALRPHCMDIWNDVIKIPEAETVLSTLFFSPRPWPECAWFRSPRRKYIIVLKVTDISLSLSPPLSFAPSSIWLATSSDDFRKAHLPLKPCLFTRYTYMYADYWVTPTEGIYICTCMHVCLYTYVHIHTYVCVCVCVCVCVRKERERKRERDLLLE